jgi:AcrR family transcriptional regulator
MNKKENRIIDKAIKLYIQNGPKKTTMDELATAANVSKVTIYKYFDDKESLYLQVVILIIETFADALSDAVHSDITYKQKIESFLDIMVKFVDSKKYELCEKLALLNDEAQLCFEGFEKAYDAMLTTLIKQGKNRGVIKNDIDTKCIYHYIDMGILYYKENDSYRQKINTDETFKQSFMRLFIQNIFIDAKEFEN